MDTFFYDNPMKAIVKACLLLFTYISSIILKEFSIEIVLPTVFLFFVTNIYDYGELAFAQNSKSKAIQNGALFIFIGFFVSAVITFCLYTTDNEKAINFVNSHYIIFYLVCATVWLIPMCDGIRAQLDLNRKRANSIIKSYHSDSAYNTMIKSLKQK